MMPKLSVGKCRHSIWASVATTNWILFCLLGYMVHARYSYIYMTNSIILLNTSDSIRVRCMIPTESDVFWTKPVGKKSSRTSKQCSVPCQKKVPSESRSLPSPMSSGRIQRIPSGMSEFHGIPWNSDGIQIAEASAILVSNSIEIPMESNGI